MGSFSLCLPASAVGNNLHWRPIPLQFRRRPGPSATRKLPLSVKILDIGCGKHKWPGSIGLDIAPLDGVDVVHDLNQFPYPFSDDTFDRIRVIHVIEHIQSIPRTMEEIHRIARHGAEIDIETPHYTDASSWQDPSHGGI